MLYDDKVKQAVVGTLEDGVLAIAIHMINLLEQGYLPNKNKTTILNWSNILIHAYENIDVLSEEQHRKLDILYNKVVKL